jgi:hypothetical protein
MTDTKPPPLHLATDAEALLQIAADTYRLPLQHACRATVLAHIHTAARMAELLNNLEIDSNDAAQAPVFRPGDGAAPT